MNRIRLLIVALTLTTLTGTPSAHLHHRTAQASARQNQPPTTSHQPPDLIERYAAAIIQRDMQRLSAQSDSPLCIETSEIAFCLDPNTPKDRLKEIQERVARFYSRGRQPQFNRRDRWVTTASGSTGALGNPIILTYSFLPDGTTIPATGEYGDGAAGSNLYATLNPRFGNNPENWKARFRECFARWSEVSGIQYVEKTDDGAAFPDSAGSSTAPVRGDVRIGMKFIDGASSVLAYNYYPDRGDMVLDSADAGSFDNPANNYRYLRDVVMHEHGHGGGLGHVISGNSGQLMEPFVNTAIDGPQDDDIRGMQRNYGDPQENDDTPATAHPLGVLYSTVTGSNISLDSESDVDWYALSFQTGQLLTVSVTPVGAEYSIGNEGGADPTPVDTTSINNLVIDVFAADGVTQIATSDAQPAGQTEKTNPLDLSALTTGNLCYIRIRNASGAADSVQRYTLRFEIPGLFVDKSHTGTELGTFGAPYRTIQAALNAASATQKTVLYVRANPYNENPVTNKPIRILNWGDTGIVRAGRP
jgi:hypothetical protein